MTTRERLRQRWLWWTETPEEREQRLKAWRDKALCAQRDARLAALAEGHSALEAQVMGTAAFNETLGLRTGVPR